MPAHQTYIINTKTLQPKFSVNQTEICYDGSKIGIIEKSVHISNSRGTELFILFGVTAFIRYEENGCLYYGKILITNFARIVKDEQTVDPKPFVPFEKPVDKIETECNAECKPSFSVKASMKAFRLKKQEDKTEPEPLDASLKKRICANVAKLSEEQIAEVLKFLNFDEMTTESLFDYSRSSFSSSPKEKNKKNHLTVAKKKIKLKS